MSLALSCDTKDAPDDSGATGLVYQETFISAYVDIESFSMERTTINGGDTQIINFFFLGTECWPEKEGDWFWKFAMKYGDSGFNRYTIPRSSYGQSIRAIDVLCSSDFDAQHSAGTSLRDIVKVLYASYYPYVHSGYQGKSDVMFEEYPLAEFVPTDGVLWDANYHYLHLIKQPASAGAYDFTVTVTLDDDRTLTSEIRLTF